MESVTRILFPSTHLMSRYIFTLFTKRGAFLRIPQVNFVPAGSSSPNPCQDTSITAAILPFTVRSVNSVPSQTSHRCLFNRERDPPPKLPLTTFAEHDPLPLSTFVLESIGHRASTALSVPRIIPVAHPWKPQAGSFRYLAPPFRAVHLRSPWYIANGR